jgi:hypothetical protein
VRPPYGDPAMIGPDSYSCGCEVVTRPDGVAVIPCAEHEEAANVS